MKTQFTSPRLQKASIFIILFLLAFCASPVKAQYNDASTYIREMDNYYDSLKTVRGSDNMSGTGYKTYLRWKLHWIERYGLDCSFSQARQTNEELTKNIQYFIQECQKHLPNGNH
jgi:hypothetical protein